MSKPISTESDAATPAMLEDNLLPFNFPAVERKKVTAAFDGGRITSDGGVMLLAAVERALGIADRLAPLITDPRNPLLVTDSVADILRGACWLSLAATRMATTSTTCAPTLASSWPADACQTAAPIFARNQLSRAGRMPPPCVRSCA